jgi:uncharacterized protein YeaO (DUF488 family)
MELLRAVGEAIGRSVTAGHWPGQGPTDEHLTEIAHNLSRARHLVEPHGRHSQQAAPETQHDIQDLHGQVMHTLYVAAHGTAVALRMTPRTFVSTSRSTIQLFQGGSEVACGRFVRRGGYARGCGRRLRRESPGKVGAVATMADVRVRRVYDEPVDNDGVRVLVDRIWPRGMTKARAALDEWCKDVAPSTELRKWYGHDPAKFEEFSHRYGAELEQAERAQALHHLRDLAADRRLTLLTASKDADISEAAVLAAILNR